MKPGNIVYGSWKDGSDIYRDSKGYYIIQWDPPTDTDFKKYLPKSWKPTANTRLISRTMKKKKINKKTHTKRKVPKRKKL